MMTASKEVLVDLQSRTTGGKWKTFEIGEDEKLCGFTAVSDDVQLIGLSFHKWRVFEELGKS